jgi:hypothetical protein
MAQLILAESAAPSTPSAGTVTMYAATDGILYAKDDAGNTYTASVIGWLLSGTYTPTLTNTTNVAASTAFTCQYMRVGNVVTVSGRVSIDPTSTGNTKLEMSLPIASNFAAIEQAGGSFMDSTSSHIGSILAEVTNNTLHFNMTAVATTNLGCSFICSYLVV